MKQLSKEQWRKIHGIRPPKDPSDPEVLQRRWLHEAIVQWEIKLMIYFHTAFAILAFTIVLLPVFSKTWREFVSTTPIISWINSEFSSLSGTLISCLTIAFIFQYYSSRKLDGKNYSEYGYPINLSHVRSAKNIALGDLYPRTRLEEKIFFSDSAGGVWLSIVAWFLLFGGFAIMIRYGGN